MTSLCNYDIGDLIDKTIPYAHVSSKSMRGLQCDECFVQYMNTSKPIKKCTRCGVYYYCSVACQKKGWKQHKNECSNLQRISPHIPTCEARLFYRICQHYMNDPYFEEKFQGRTRILEDLKSHTKEIYEDKSRIEKFTELIRTMTSFTQEKFFRNAQQIIVIFGQMLINAITILDEEQNKPIGVGLYLGLSTLNHSCTPNCVPVYRGNEISIRAIKNISVGDELTISYIDCLVPTNQRRETLQKMYYFTCECDVCCGGRYDSLKLSMKCPEDDCKDGIVEINEESHSYLGKCMKCSKIISKSTEEKYREIMTLAENTINEVEQIHKNPQIESQIPDHERVLAAYNEHLTEICSTLSDFNVYVVKIYDGLLDAYLKTQHYQKSLEFCSLAMPAYRKYFGECDPQYYLHSMKLARLYWHFGDEAKSRELLNQVENVINKFHEPNTFLVKTLNHMLAK